MKDIQIYVDSSCDLSSQILKKNNIKMIPMEVTIDGKIYRDRDNIMPKEFYKKVKNIDDVPTTSQISPNRYMESFEKDIKKKKKIIYISLSSKLSGTHNSARLAKNMLEYDNLYIVNSKKGSLATGIMAIEAAKMTEENCSIEEILDKLHYMADVMKTLVVPGSLDMLKKGGRLSTTTAIVGNLMKIRPVLKLNEDGELVIYEKIRGDKAVFKFYKREIEKHGVDKNYPVAICTANNEKIMSQFKKQIEEEYDIKDFVISDLGATIGSHIGEGSILFCFMPVSN